jgi:hypothetical protein
MAEYEIKDGVGIIPEGTTRIPYESFKDCKELTKIVIPDTVTTIDKSAFSGCTGLTSIVIPDSVTRIWDDAFENCTGLTSIVIPDSVTRIYGSIFNGCTGLTSIKVSEGNKKYDSRNNCNAIIETEANILIEGCAATVIPDSVTGIRGYAFKGHTGLTSIFIPASVTDIVPNAFEDCSNLTSIKVSEENETYDSREDCNAIIETATNSLIVGCKNSIIPETVTVVNKEAFKNCVGLHSIDFPKSLTKIGDSAFWGSGIKKAIIPDSVTEIGRHAFRECHNLEEVRLSSAATELDHTFYDCTALKSIEIPASVTSFDNSALYNCTSMESIRVAAGNTVYDSRGDCNAVIETESNNLLCGCMNTVIPDTVEEIGSYAFLNCTGLKSITIPNSVKKMWTCFKGCTGLTSLEIPASVEMILGCITEGCINLKSIKVAPDNPKYDSREDCNAIIWTEKNCMESACPATTIPSSVTKLGGYEGQTELESIVIPDTVTVIGSDAFSGCTSLKSIEIPASVTLIESGAFEGCTSLTNITIPKTVKEVELDIFYNCTNLESVEILNGTLKIDKDSSLFHNCPKVKVYVPEGKLQRFQKLLCSNDRYVRLPLDAIIERPKAAKPKKTK